MQRYRAIIKRPDEKYGHVTNISTSLENLQKLVDGYIETLRLPDGSVLLMNEDGKLKDLPFNMRGPRGEQIVGDIVVLGQHGSEFADCTMEFKTWKYLVDLWR